jgi:hypothetical protein
LLLAVFGGGCWFNQPGDVRQLDPFYHTVLIGRQRWEL